MRTLPLVPAFREKLLHLRNEQENNRKLCGRCYSQEFLEYIFVDEMGNLMAPNYISSMFPTLLKKNNLRKIRFHDLRHSCASLLIADGVSMKYIQEWLGHSDFSITANVYAHLDYSSKLSSAAAMQNVLQFSVDAFSMQSTITSDSIADWPDMISSLLCSGVPVELVQEWLKKEDLIGCGNIKEHFANFIKSCAIDDNKNCQPISQ